MSVGIPDKTFKNDKFAAVLRNLRRYSFLGKSFKSLAFFSITIPAVPDSKRLACSQRTPDIHEVVKCHFQLSLWVGLHEQEVFFLTSKLLWSKALN